MQASERDALVQTVHRQAGTLDQLRATVAALKRKDTSVVLG